jgi:p-aminobenzoyl-glutamate transporter AbgT
LSGLGAIAAGVAAGYADYVNAPLVAPYLDGITRHAFLWIPALQSLPEEAWWFTSGAAAGLFVFGAAMVSLALCGGLGNNRRRQMEAQFRRRMAQQEKDHWADFNS